jgi:hypothetical protein
MHGSGYFLVGVEGGTRSERRGKRIKDCVSAAMATYSNNRKILKREQKRCRADESGGRVQRELAWQRTNEINNATAEYENLVSGCKGTPTEQRICRDKKYENR